MFDVYVSIFVLSAFFMGLMLRGILCDFESFGEDGDVRPLTDDSNQCRSEI